VLGCHHQDRIDMSDEVNAQECAIQLAKVCGRLIRNARLLAELENGLRLANCSIISIIELKMKTGREARCDRGQLLIVLTSGWRTDPERQSDFGTAGDGKSVIPQRLNELNDSMDAVETAPGELRRLLLEGKDNIRKAIRSIPRQPNEETFGTEHASTLTQAILKFSRKTVEKFESSLIEAIREMREVDVPNEEDVEDQILSEFRFVASTDGSNPNPPNTDDPPGNDPPNDDSLPPEAALLKIAKEKCKNSEVKAWVSEQHAIRNHGEFKNLPLTYEWLSENFDDSAEDLPDDLRGYELPSDGTWKRHVRAVRKATDTQVNRSRKGREHGGSVVGESDI
jgi:hypothetical protein